MGFSPCRLLIWTLFGLSFPVPSVLAEAIDDGKAIAPVTVAPSFCEGFTPLTNRVAPLVFELSISHIFLNIKFDKKRKVCKMAQGGSMGGLI